MHLPDRIRSRHVDIRVVAALSERRFHHVKTLVECEARCPDVPRENFFLLSRRVEAVFECRVPGHGIRSVTPTTDSINFDRIAVVDHR
jgi:hypothetical protein